MPSTARYSGWIAEDTRIRFDFLPSSVISAPSVRAVAPSYMEAFESSMPVSIEIRVWYSKKACKDPWLISGWYGV